MPLSSRASSQFFSDVKEAEERMKKMQETLKKKYCCDRSTTATRLEDLLQDAVVRRLLHSWTVDGCLCSHKT